MESPETSPDPPISDPNVHITPQQPVASATPPPPPPPTTTKSAEIQPVPVQPEHSDNNGDDVKSPAKSNEKQVKKIPITKAMFERSEYLKSAFETFENFEFIGRNFDALTTIFGADDSTDSERHMSNSPTTGAADVDALRSAPAAREDEDIPLTRRPLGAGSRSRNTMRTGKRARCDESSESESEPEHQSAKAVALRRYSELHAPGLPVPSYDAVAREIYNVYKPLIPRMAYVNAIQEINDPAKRRGWRYYDHEDKLMFLLKFWK